MEPRLKSIYKSQILPELKSSLGVKNTMQVPKIDKIVFWLLFWGKTFAFQ